MLTGLAWFDPDDRFYVVGKLMKRQYDGGDREALHCPNCQTVMMFLYPSLTYDNEPYLAVCTQCKLEVSARRAPELWVKVIALMQE